MKKVLLSLFIASFFIKLNAQSAKQNIPLAIEDTKTDEYLLNRKPATLIIQIKNAPDTARKTKIKYTLVTFGSNFQVEKYTQTDEHGFVKITLEQNLPYQQLWLSAGDYLYAGVFVNTGLAVTIDASKIKKDGISMIGDGVEYSGNDGEFNTVINKHVLYKRDQQNKLSGMLTGLYSIKHNFSDSAFIQKIDSIQQALNLIDDEFILQFPKYDSAIRNETNSKVYQWLCNTYIGDVIPKKLFNKINNHKPFFTSNDGVLFYRSLSMYISYKKDNPQKSFEEEILNKKYSTYDRERKDVIDSINYYLKLTKEKEDKKPAALVSLYRKQNKLFATEIEAFNIHNSLEIIDSIYEKPKCDILKTFLLEIGKNSFAKSYPEILNSTQTLWCREIVANELATAMIKQKKIDSLLASSKQLNNTEDFIGAPLEKLPFNAYLYRLDSIKNIDDFIINLKSRFQNKAIVIDFWATWCAPCLKDLPFSKKLHESNKDLPIEYVYICTNSSSNIDIWKNKIADLQLSGTHIFMDEKIVASLKSNFNSAGSGFPTFIVIGINGKLRPTAIQWIEPLDRDKLKDAVGL